MCMFKCHITTLWKKLYEFCSNWSKCLSVEFPTRVQTIKESKWRREKLRFWEQWRVLENQLIGGIYSLQLTTCKKAMPHYFYGISFKGEREREGWWGLCFHMSETVRFMWCEESKLPCYSACITSIKFHHFSFLSVKDAI